MSVTPEIHFRRGAAVWVWDSTWLPAVVVHSTRMGSRLVRLEHGVTFRAGVADLAARDPSCRGDDIPSASVRYLNNGIGTSRYRQ
jgi:hypothetical protein